MKYNYDYIFRLDALSEYPNLLINMPANDTNIYCDENISKSIVNWGSIFWKKCTIPFQN